MEETKVSNSTQTILLLLQLLFSFIQANGMTEEEKISFG